MANSVIVKFEGVTAGYNIVQPGLKSLRKAVKVVLKDINLEIRDEERVVVIGESGSGKSTLLKVAMGLLPPLRGKVYLLGKDLYRLGGSERKRVLSQIGFVPQDPYRALDPSLKVKHALREPLEALKFPEPEKRIREVMKLVHLPEEVLEYYPADLSGGMRQRVLIARAIVHDPEILFLDEPTSALDVSLQSQIINLILELYSKLRFTLVTVTHDLGVAQYLGDRAIILYRGEIVEEGPFIDILRAPRASYTEVLLKSYKASL